MEFPDLGRNCMFNGCNKLDFLPVKCNACKEVFCADHFTYANHDCTTANNQDVQVPVCPLCLVPVPGRRGEAPDVAVGAHIDNQCTSDPAVERRNKVFTNRCSYKGCKVKELVPLVCDQCSLNHCLRHRHTADHACMGKLAAKRARAAAAAMVRINNANMTSQTAVSTVNDIQGNMTEDEALARALALSMQEPTTLQERDRNFARALNRQRVGGDSNTRCRIS